MSALIQLLLRSETFFREYPKQITEVSQFVTVCHKVSIRQQLEGGTKQAISNISREGSVDAASEEHGRASLELCWQSPRKSENVDKCRSSFLITYA